MKTIFTLGFLLSTLLYLCTADIYLHNPHGSNNRLNGNQANVRNANRLFDSQVCLNLLIRNIFLASHAYIYCRVALRKRRNWTRIWDCIEQVTLWRSVPELHSGLRTTVVSFLLWLLSIPVARNYLPRFSLWICMFSGKLSFQLNMTQPINLLNFAIQ